MKQKSAQNSKQAGFTVVELLVVLMIMILLASIVIIDFNRQRNKRSLVLAQNETVTNIRKVQSYMLSSRNISPQVAAKYYLLTFRTGQTWYSIQAIDENYGVHDVETVNFPNGTAMNEITLLEAPKNEASQSCVQVIFAAPFAKMLINHDSKCDNIVVETLRDPVSAVALTEYGVELSIINIRSSETKNIGLNIISGRIDAL